MKKHFLSIFLCLFFVSSVVFAQSVPTWYSTGGGGRYLQTVDNNWGLKVAGLATSTTGCLGVNSSGWISANGSTCAAATSITGGTAGMLTSWLTGTTLTATGTPTAASYVATSSTASRFPYASTTAVTSSGTSDFGGLVVTGTSDFQGSLSDSNSFLTINDDLSVLGVGTSTFAGNVSIAGNLEIGILGFSYTGINAPYFNATSTSQTSTFTFAPTFSSLTSALVLTGAGGLTAEYTGASCTNQFVRSLDALGAASCATVALATDTSGTLTVSRGGTGLTTFGGTNTILYTTSADTLASEAAFTYDSTADRLTATYASTTFLTTSAGATFATASGNVGIGTTSPSGVFSVTNAGAGFTTYIEDATGDATPFVIDNNGIVGIGITNPASTKLQVAEADSNFYQLFSNLSGTARLSIGSDASGNPQVRARNNLSLQLSDDSGNGVNIIDGGNVGIGTTSPSAKFSVTGAGTGTGRLVAFSDGDPTPTERFTILDNGTVGISSSSPSAALSIGNGTSQPSNRTGLLIGYTTDGYKALHIQTGSTDGSLYVENTYTSYAGTLAKIISARTDSSAFTLLSLDNATGNKMTVLGNGNVGIGTTSPAQLFSVAGAGYFTGNVGVGIASPAALGAGIATVDIRGSSGGGVAALTTGGAGGYLYATAAQLYVQSTTGLPIRFLPGGSEKVTMLSDGNVGIGTTSPKTFLHVEGANTATRGQLSVQSTGAQAEGARLTFYPGGTFAAGMSADSTKLEVDLQGSRYFVVSGGNVGIGTTTPNALFTIQAANPIARLNATSAGQGTLQFQSQGVTKGIFGLSGAWEGDTTTDTMMTAETGGGLRFYTNGSGTERMVIDSSGNVGIGTTSPTLPLSVTSSSNNSAYFAGNIGIGTNAPTQLLDVRGYGRIDAGVATFKDGSDTNQAGPYFALQNPAGTESSLFQLSASNNVDLWQYNGSWGRTVTFTKAGNVGIGTTSPLFKLVVQNSSEGDTLQLYDTDGNCKIDPDSGGLTTTCSSDARLKTNIRPTADQLAYLKDIKIRDYTVIASGDRRTGVIAQELQKTHPELVHMGEDGLYGVEEVSSWKLVRAIQQLWEYVTGQNDKIEKLEARVKALEAKLK